MSEVADTVDDAVDALVGTPTSDEVFFATIGFSAREIASSAISRGGGGHGGGVTDIIDAASEFGVVGDNSTDNTTALAAAIAAAPYTIAGLSGNDVLCREVKLPPGRICIQPDAINTVPNLTLSGHGRSATYLVINKGGSTGVGITNGNGDPVQVTLRDFGMVSQGFHDHINWSQSGSPSVTDMNHVIENMLFVGGGRSVVLTGSSEVRLLNLVSTRQSPANGQGVFELNASDMMIAFCTISDIQSADGTTCTPFSLSCANSRVVNCKAFGPAGLITGFNPAFFLTASRSQLIGCEVQDYPGHGVYFGGEWLVNGLLIDSILGTGVVAPTGGSVGTNIRVMGNRGGGSYTTANVLDISESYQNRFEILADATPARYLSGGELGYRNDLTFNYEKAFYSKDYAATYAHDPLLGGKISMTLTGNLSLSAPASSIPNGIHVGMQLVFLLTQDGTGGRTVTLNGIFKTNHSDTGNTAGKVCSIRVVYDGTSWIGTSGGWL